MEHCRPGGSIAHRLRSEARDIVSENRRYIVHALCCPDCDLEDDAKMLLNVAGYDPDTYLTSLLEEAMSDDQGE